jgi:hypothetical protein
MSNSIEDLSVTLEITRPDDYRAIQFTLARTALRPVSEDWPEWQPGSPRRITFVFETIEDADFARVALFEFLPAAR